MNDTGKLQATVSTRREIVQTSSGRDWSEEAIIERDPSYQLGSAGEEYATAAEMPAELRRELAAALVALGMPAWRATAAAEL